MLVELATTWVIVTALLPDEHPAPAALATTIAAAMIVVAVMLQPPSVGRGGLDILLGAVEIACVAVLLAATSSRIRGALLAYLGVATGVLGLLVGAATRWLRNRTTVGPSARIAVLTALGLLGAAPLWAGPAIERLGAPSAAVNGVIALSPLTYVAVMCGFDYLRSPWIYMTSPMGSLRFDYPHAAAATAAWAALALGCLWLGHAPDERNAFE